MNSTAYIVNRKWEIALFTIFYFLLTQLAVPVFAAFEDVGTGARAAALGNAYTAVGDDTLSLYYNPAGLARLQEGEIATEYSRLYTGLTDGTNLSHYLLAVGVPLSWGTLSAGWKQMSLDDLYEERTLSLGYARWFGKRLAIGGAVKQLHHSFTAPSTTVDDNGNILPGTPSLFAQEGDGASAYAGDVGVLYRLGRQQWLGVSVRNINTPNVSLDSSDTDQVARTVRGSWAYQDTYKFSATLDAEFEQKPGGPHDRSVTGALEKGWTLGEKSAVFARGAFTEGSRELRQMSSGFGARLGRLQVDYAFLFHLSGVRIGDSMGTHRVSLTYRFGTVPRNMTPIEPRTPPVSVEQLAPKETGNVIDVPKKDWDVFGTEETP
jgi:hypothetical protein